MRIDFLPILFYVDNTTLNSGSGGDVIASDDIAGVKHQKVKVEWGVDGTATETSASNPLPVVQTGALPAGTANIGDVDVLTLPALVAGTALIGKVGIDQTTPGTTNNVTVSSITPPTLTKGTQGSTGYSTQDLKDAGRTYVTYTATALAAGATTVETMQTLTKVVQPATSTSGTSHTPTSGKRYRIQSIIFSVVGHATATTQSTNFSIRCNPSGATINTSVLIMKVRLQTPATTLAYASYTIQVPDGLELVGDGTLTFGVSTNSTFTTNAPTMDVNIIGYEY